jgi:FkbH-like protein
MSAEFTDLPDVDSETLLTPKRKPARRLASALLPVELGVKSSGKLSIAVVGTCVAELFANTCDPRSWKIDHFLMHALNGPFAPDAPLEQYDAILVQITLRQLFHAISEHGDDLHYLRHAPRYNGILTSATTLLKQVITRVVEAIAGAKPTFFLAFNEPPSTHQGILLNNRHKSLYHFVRTLNDQMADALDGVPNSYYIEINDLLRYYGDARISDAYSRHFTHAAFLATQETRSFALAILERIRNALTILAQESPIKLIITDLDNTLWRGVLAELDEIVPYKHVEGWPIGYAEALLEFKRRGGLLAICSKNDYKETIDRFNQLWRRRLRRNDFCSVKINWLPKSKNIAEILAETNILPSNVLFIDDNPHEIEEVKQAFPEIRTLTGTQENWRSVILWSAETQVAVVSEESTKRTQLVRAKQARDLGERGLNRDDYLRSLGIEVHFDVIRDSSSPKYARAVELINKTNQFNTTGKRWSPADLQSLFSKGGFFVALSATDKHGDNGLVCLALVCDCEITQVVMSCRVFGFSLETALLCRVFEVLDGDRECNNVLGRLVDTGKNKACAQFYKTHGFVELEHVSGMWQSKEAPAWPNWIRRM